MILGCVSVSARSVAQNQRVSLNLRNCTVMQLFEEIQQQTRLFFFYDQKHFQGQNVLTVRADDEEVGGLLKRLFADKNVEFVFEDQTVIVRPAVSRKQVNGKVVKGVVRDAAGHVLPGVTVVLKGTTLGTSTDIDGKYTLTLPEGEHVLVFSMIGMKMQEFPLGTRTELDVTLQEEVAEMEEVVVTGIFKKAKESYTGAVSSIDKEQLKIYKGQNLLQTLKNIDVSINLAVDNINGSNPNRMPQVNIRGNSSLPMSVQEYNESLSNEVNTPLIILDGFEIALERLMDYNDEEIESINILKDAAATAIYGSRGSNGVIVVTTKQPEAGKLRVNAEIGIDIEAPDLTSYDLLNAAEKLQLEWDLGLYKNESLPSNDVWYKEAYAKRKRAIASGTDTDWLSKPLHTGVGSHYNLRMEGGSDEFRWSASVGYKNTQGAMRDSERKSLNTSLTLMYKVKNFTFKNQASYGTTKSKESKYGTFSDYVKQQPYNAPYDENGKLVRMFDGFHAHYQGYQNPLYDATLNSFDKSSYRTLTDNFAIEWNPFEGLTLRGQVGITATDNTSDRFLPAEHSTFTDDSQYETDEGFLRRGTYDYTTGRTNEYTGNITLSYTRTFADKHQVYVGLDYSLNESEGYNYAIAAEGFTNEDIHFLASARQYAKDEGPGGSKSKSRRLGLTANVNYIYDNRYFVDFSYRVDGKSDFGSKKRYAPFWSTGIGWNLHNEQFLQGHPVLTTLRLKASYGETGSQQGSSTGASTTYKYSTDNKYMNWNGTILQGWGNPKLTWQKTDEFNVGMEFGLWTGRVKGEINVYTKKTANLLSNMDLPLSMGFSSYIANVGEVENKGWEASFSGYAIRNSERRMNLMFSGQLVYNKNKITKLSDAIKAQNELYLQEDVDVSNLFYEGRPQNAIYAVRSLGIDPSTGNEIFLDKNGKITDTWKPSDKVYLGSKDQKYRGNGSIMFMWKGLTVNVACSYYWGGKVYNETLLNKVEVTKNTLSSQNVDARVLKSRWFQAGDVTFFKQLSNTQTRATSRFVMDDNVFEISSIGVQYRWDTPWIQKYTRATSITFGVNMSDILHLSSIKMERGTSYPYARNIQGYIKFLF